MEPITLFIGKISAIYWLVYGLGFLISQKFYANQLLHSSKSDSLAVTLQGAIHLYIGAAIITNHFLWGNLLAILVTLLGFMYLAKGIVIIVIPEFILKLGKPTVITLRLSGIGFILLGLVLGYLSFFAYLD